MTFGGAGALAGWLTPIPLGLLGLLVGGWTSLLITRLPRRMELDWWREIAAQLDEDSAWSRVLHIARPPAYDTIGAHIEAALVRRVSRGSLVAPGRGEADHVGPPRWYAGAALRGRDAAVSLATGGLFAAAAWRFGQTPATLAWCAALALILAMAMIDWDTRLLPDSMTLSLTAGGLACAALGWTIPPTTAIWGAVAGFLALWGIAWPFRQVTGKEGMAAGDFKLLAALGAWLGWQAILPIALLASVAGAVVGLPLKMSGRLAAGQPIPFGPFLAAGGVLVIFVGVDRVLGWIGVR